VLDRLVNQGQPMIFKALPEPELDEEEFTDHRDSLFGSNTELNGGNKSDPSMFCAARLPLPGSNTEVNGGKKGNQGQSLFAEQMSTAGVAEREEEEKTGRKKRDPLSEAGKRAGVDVRDELPLPVSKDEEAQARHTDKYLQTQLFAHELEKRLRHICTTASSIVDETGQNQLFLAMGFLEWVESAVSDKTYEAPLVLIPVKINRSNLDKKTYCYDYSISYQDEELFSNLSLKEKLSNDFDIILPPFDDKALASETGESGLFDPEAYFQLVGEAISNLKGWRVLRKMVVGFFSFSKFLMYRDLDPTQWKNDSLSENPLIKKLLGGSDEEEASFESDGELDESALIKALPLVMDADSSQTSAIMEALNGRSIVIQGPPGTGKSQTITNLIASFISEGKSVLFVAEKVAALNVVKHNLKKVHLEDFCLELHSHKAQKKEVLNSLQERLRRTFGDARQIDSEIERLGISHKRLAEYANSLQRTVGPFGESVFEVLGKQALLYPKVEGNGRITIENVDVATSRTVDENRELLEQLPAYCNQSALPSKNIWHGYVPAKLFYGDQQTVQGIIESVANTLGALWNKLAALTLQLDIQLEPSKISLAQVKAFSSLGSQAIPQPFFQELVELFTLSDSSDLCEVYSRLKHFIALYEEECETASKTLASPSTISTELSNKAANILTRLEKEGLLSLSLDRAKKTKECWGRLNALLTQISVLTEKQVADGLPEPHTIAEYEQFIKIAALLRHRPLGTNSQDASLLFNRSTYQVFAKARSDAKEMEKQKDRLAEFFVLSDIPPADARTELRKTFRSAQGNLFPSLSPVFREAKRRLRGFLVNPSLAEFQEFRTGLRAVFGKPRTEYPRILEELDQLEAFVSEKQAFAENTHSKQALGEYFQGVDTDWAMVEESVSWAETLSAATQSANLARTLTLITDEAKDEWVRMGEHEALLRSINEEIGEMTILLQGSRLAEVILTIYKTPIEQLLTVLGNLDEMMSSAYQLLRPLVVSTGCTLASVYQSIRAVDSAHSIRTQIEMSGEYKGLLHSYFCGVETDTKTIDATIEWSHHLKQLDLPMSIVRFIVGIQTNETLALIGKSTHGWDDVVGNIRATLAGLEAFGQLDENVFFGDSLENVTFDKLGVICEQLLKHINYLPKWAEYCRLTTDARRKGLGHIIDIVESGDLPSELASDIYLHAVYDALCRKTINENPTLLHFTRAQHEKTIETFSVLDKAIQELCQKRVGHKASRKKPPAGTRKGVVGRYTEMGLLHNEFAKRKRHIPIRRLLERAGDSIKCLKPVFMMSPMSVAQFLAPEMHHFDVVIMDEASQIRPEEALGAIARGSQLIVVGDPKQLPPTNFFDAMLSNPETDYEENATDDMDSVLDICLAANMSTKRLLWHYRSEHESLIAFSNSTWYNNELIIFPSPDSSNTDLGIRFTYVEGATYAASRNYREADVVARRIIEHARNTPHLSLGVGTFNSKQRDLIEDILEKLKRKDAAVDSAVEHMMRSNNTEPLFIKNLENLQGDERDVIIISFTFGPDAKDRRVFQRFGPITCANGPRRLNVLFSRAKKRMEVFTSMQPDDIISGPGASEGANALKAFLVYAKTGKLPDFGTITNREPDSDFEIAVARELTKRGYAVEYQVGVGKFFIDLGIYHPHKDKEFILGVECDGAKYHSSRYARDRDRLREEVLRRRRWNIHRIWSTDWFKNRDVEIARLIQTVEQLVEQDTHVVAEDHTASIASPNVLRGDQAIHMPDEMLAGRLMAYARENIHTTQETAETGGISILCREVMPYLVKCRPTSMEEFRDSVPSDLRSQVSSEEIQYLDDVFDIIQESL